MAIEYSVDDLVEIKSEGSFTISSKFINQYVSLVNDEKITIELLSNSSLSSKLNKWNKN